MDEIDRWWRHWWRGQQWWRGWWRGWCCAGSCATSRWGLPWFQLFSRDGPLQGECLPSSYIFFLSVFVTFVRWHLQGDHVICHFLLASIHMSHSANHLLYGHCQMKYHMKYFSFLSWGQKPVWHPRPNNVWRKSKRIILQIVTQFENKYLPSFVCLIIPAHIFCSAFTSNFVSSEGALYVILPYDYPAAPTFWTHTGP